MTDLGIGSYGFGFVAGLLSTLSPCILPIAPILLGSAASTHRHAPLALAGGLALSYAILGTTLTWAGASLGVDTLVFRDLGAVILGLFGAVLISGTLQERFATLTSGVGNAGNRFLSRLRLDGTAGQFVIGLVLGVVWSPCVGPTLGAAILLASQGSHLAQVAAVMAMFGLGATLPLVAIAYASRGAMDRMRTRLMNVGKAGKIVLGSLMIALSVMMLTGADKPVEAWLVTHSPDSLTHLTTRF